MRGPHNIWRLARTGATFERTGAMGAVLEAMEAPRAIRIAARVLGWPLKWFGLRGDPDMPPVPRALQALGPAYIKFGQILSTRPDVVGPEMAHLKRALPKEINGYHFEDAKQLESALVKMPLSGDVIMVKSSNGIGLSRIVKKMRDNYKAVDRSD